MAAPRASSAAASQKLTLGLICRTLGVEDVDAILNLRALHLDGLRIDRVGNLEAFAGTLKELHLQRNRIASKRRTSGVPRRVLDLSGNALEAVPVSLPGASLTVLDLRGNAFGDGVPDTDRGRVLAACPAEELDGAAVERRGGAAPEARPWRRRRRPPRGARGTAGRPARARRLRALAGDRPGEPRRTVALRFDAGADLEAVARDFCAAHDLDGPGAAEALLEALRDAPAAPPGGSGRQGERRPDALDPAIERAFAGLAKFEGDADGALDATRATRTALLMAAARWRALARRGPRAPGSAMPEKAGAPGYGKVPPRIAAINDRKAVGGKISSRSQNMLDIHFLIQREYTYKDEAAKRQAKRDAKA
ncbi:hypothetical protein JL720_16225 [Aureococcus anophagefferens]|nr:hypothetical protein JL720_16225 [Aureococcus anophagefferens]